MCGILALWNQVRRPQEPELHPRLDRALASMRHRGPDESGRWISADGALALAQTRLAVMGVANGRQPLANEDGTIIAVVNGELYEYERLRGSLEEAGHRFTSDTDSELVLHLYEEHGLECFCWLRGEFAFVLWDAPRQRLVAARDRFGIKPLHYAECGGEWLFASEIKALLAAGLPACWGSRALAHALTHQYLPPGETLFAGVRQIPPAHFLVLNAQGLRLTSYWRPPYPAAGAEPALPGDAAASVRHALQEAVRLRLRGDVPVACTLSGGLDSSAVAVLTARELARPVDCFSVRFDAPGYDEGPLVWEDAQALGGLVQVHEVPVRRVDLATELERAVWHGEGLTINGQLVGKFLLSRALQAAGYKVVLAGEGADEAFLGYAHLQHDYAAGLADTPAALRAQFALQRGVMLPAEGSAVPWTPPPWLGFVPAFVQAKLAFGRHFLHLLHPAAGELLAGEDWLGAALEPIHRSGELGMKPTPVRRSAWLWTRLCLGGYILRTLGDAAELAHSVEARLPFLDHPLFELAARLPTAACFRGEHSKAILREALAPVLPDAVRLRPKHPFLAPPLLTGGEPAVREFVADTLRSAACAALPFFDHAAVVAWSDRLAQASPEQQAALDPVLMTLLSATLLQKSYRLTL